MKFAHYAEYYAMRTAVAGLRLLGWNGAARAGELLGRVGFHTVRIRRLVAERQIAFAFPEFDTDRVRRTAAASYAHLGRTAIEASLLPTMGREHLLKIVDEVHGWNLVEDALKEGRGFILVTGHLGNWELGGSYLAARGLEIAAVVRRMNNPLFHEYLGRTRASFGVRLLQDTDAIRHAPRHLRGNGVLGLIMDQGVMGLASTFVPFFGRLARTPKGPAVLSIRLKAPVIFGTCIRRADGGFTLSFESVPAVTTGDRDADVDALVAAYTAVLERWVRTAPEQYFWVHRRWRRQPEGKPMLEDDQI